MRLDQLDPRISDADTAQRWQDILDQLNAGDMPPEEAEQPTLEETKAIIEALTRRVETARQDLSDSHGEVQMRKLNRREYVNSVYELLGVKVPLQRLPDDPESEGFDTVGRDQMFTSLHLETYLDIGKKASLEALTWLPKPHKKPKVHRIDDSAKVFKDFNQIVDIGDQRLAGKREGKSWQEMGFEDAGQAEIFFRQFWIRVDLPRRYTELPLAKNGIYLSSLNNGRSARGAIHADPRGQYRFRIRGGFVDDPPEERKIVRLENVGNQFAGTLKFNAPASKPEILETHLEPVFGANRHRIIVWLNDKSFPRQKERAFALDKGKHNHKDPWAPLWIDWMEFEGPFYENRASQLERIFYPKGRGPRGQAKPQKWNDEHVHEILTEFAYRAFRRRTPPAEYIQRLVDNFKNARRRGVGFTEALSESFAIILSSPSFLYLVEAQESERASSELSNRELAIRLSYYLWSSPPDDALYAANLLDTETLGKEIDRMLADPRSKAFIEGFVSQWADLDRFDAITISPKEHPKFNLGLRQAARAEVQEFFGLLIKENLPSEHLIDSEFSMLNAVLALHYGVSTDLQTQGFSKVTLPPDSPRGGLTTQAAILMLGSNGERSSPVIRGAFVMEKLLHDKPKPPPPNVPELGASTDQPLTNRQLVKHHQRQNICASCHVKMDAIGFGLENFDATGRWRDTERVGDKQVPIDPSSQLPNGKAFNSSNELKRILLLQKHKLAEELAESLMSYGLGRPLGFSDQEEIERILSKLEPSDYPLRSMIKEVAVSQLFKKR